LFAFENGKLSDSENATWLASLPREALAINWLSTVYRSYAAASTAVTAAAETAEAAVELKQQQTAAFITNTTT